MPAEVKNCLSCKWEPEWHCISSASLPPREGLHEGGLLFAGYCRWREERKIPPCYTLNGGDVCKIGDYVDFPGWEAGTICLTWQPKEYSHA